MAGNRNRFLGVAFLLIFFVSGFAALLYQTVWQRMLTFFSGADIYSVTIVVAAFMAGLGFGHLAGGHLADRLTARQRIAVFAACETAVGLFALVSTFLYYDVLYGRFGATNVTLATLAIVVFMMTLWPTFLMGMSLPLAARTLADCVSEPARWIPLLYGWNTLGAAAGSFMAVAVLFRAVDLPGILRIGAALSIACGLGVLVCAPALAASAREGRAGNNPPADAATGLEDGSSSHGLATWIAVYALSGFVALSLEMVWFRVLGVISKSNAFTFGYLLGIYLTGVGLGALIGHSRLVQNVRAAPAFFAAQAAIPVYAAAALGLLVLSVGRLEWGRPLWDYMGSYEALAPSDFGLAVTGDGSRLGALIGSYVVVPLVLIAPPTILMGVSFGLLQRLVQTDVRVLGRRVGWLQTANVVGAMLGAMVTGLFLLANIGSGGTVRMLCLAGLLFAWLYARAATGNPIWRSAPAVACLVAVFFSVPPPSTLWARLHAAIPTDVIQQEDGSGLSLLKRRGPSQVIVYVNGLGQSELPYGGVHTALGALPVLLHPSPRAIAVIGLGSGDTLFATGGREETERIDNIEIIGAQLTTLRELRQQQPYPALDGLLNDSRVHFYVTDGRAFIRTREFRYDIIEADALRPTSAYAGNLYSVEYFQLLRDHLQPGGYAVTWAATERIRNGMAQVFPHVVVISDVAVGSTEPIESNIDLIRERLKNPFTADYYRRGALNIERVLEPYLAAPVVTIGPTTDRTALTDVNRDLFPKDEFAVR